MEVNRDSIVGRHCRLVRPVRDTQGISRFTEEPVILRTVDNLGTADVFGAVRRRYDDFSVP